VRVGKVESGTGKSSALRPSGVMSDGGSGPLGAVSPKAEVEARAEKRGLWADPHGLPPWEWRRIQREKQASDRQPVQGDYWLNTSSGVRHNRSCEWFGKTAHGRVCGAGEGKACGMCGG
jgi:hypothetical protein